MELDAERGSGGLTTRALLTAATRSAGSSLYTYFSCIAPITAHIQHRYPEKKIVMHIWFSGLVAKCPVVDRQMTHCPYVPVSCSFLQNP